MVPLPDAARHSILSLAQNGQMARGYQCALPQALQVGTVKRPCLAAFQNASFSTLTVGEGIFRASAMTHSRSMIRVALQWRVPSCMPVPCTSARSQFFTCTLGCASPRNCRTASITLVMPPRLAGWLLHKPPPSVLNGNLPTPEIKFPSETNLPPEPLAQNPKSSICISTVTVKLS